MYLCMDTSYLIVLENRRGAYFFLALSESAQLTASKEILINVTRKQARGHSAVSPGPGCDHVSDFTITYMFATQVLIG